MPSSAGSSSQGSLPPSSDGSESAVALPEPLAAAVSDSPDGGVNDRDVSGVSSSSSAADEVAQLVRERLMMADSVAIAVAETNTNSQFRKSNDLSSSPPKTPVKPPTAVEDHFLAYAHSGSFAPGVDVSVPKRSRFNSTMSKEMTDTAERSTRTVTGAMGTSAILPPKYYESPLAASVPVSEGLPSRRMQSHDLLGQQMIVAPAGGQVGGGGVSRYASAPLVEPTPEMLIQRQVTIEFRALSTLISESQTKMTRGVEKLGVTDPTAAQYLSTEYHLLGVEDLLKNFNSNKAGLRDDQISALVKQYGQNTIKPMTESMWKKIAGYLFGGFCSLMWVSSAICWVAWKPIGDPPDPMNMALAIVLLVVIFFQAGFTAYQDWSTGQVMNSINNMLPAEALVLRNGQRKRLSAIDIVPGDIVCLTLGDKVPADLRLITVSPDLRFDRSILTGEPDAIPGTVDTTDANYLESHNIAMMGTYVTDGSGIGLCVSIGDQTVMGKIAMMSSSREQERTLLQIEITRFVRIIACLSITTALLTIILWVAWLRVQYPTFESTSEALVNAIAVLVAFTPEGLPIAVTLTLTVVARQMHRQMLLCKNLSVIDTLGSISVLASDKTGTLTQNKMSVVSIGFVNSTYKRHSIRKELRKEDIGLFQSIRLAAAVCNDASFDPTQIELPVNERKVIGQATDAGLLRFAEEFESVEADKERFEPIFELPFNSKNKYMLKVLKPRVGYAGYEPESCVMFVKGGPDVLMKLCNSCLGPNGERLPLNDENMEKIVTIQEAWSREGQRCLLLTQKIMSDAEFPVASIDSWAMEELVCSKVKGLTIIGLVGILDPPRPEIPGVLKVLRAAHIRVFMVTGDFQLTACAIARQIGIITTDKVDTLEDLDKGTATVVDRSVKGSEESDFNKVVTTLCLSGNDLRAMDDKHWDSIVTYSEIVFARTTPEQKLKIVAEFKGRDCIVGVTGDGVNDTPALKAANVGIAMGGGSDVAMEAADMVFLDNNFSSITVAIESGRLVFDNIKKVILYLIPAGTFSELVPILASIFLGIPLPLSAFLMICICVFTDLSPSLALMYEKPEADIMSRVPRNPKKDRLVDAKFFGQVYFFIGLIECIFAHTMFFYYLNVYGNLSFGDVVFAFDKWTDGFMGKTQDELDELQRTGQSVYFVTLVVLQWGNLFCARTRRLSVIQQNPLSGATRNLRLFGAILITVLIAVILTEVNFINDIFYTRSVPWEHWLIPIALATALLLMEEGRKLIVRKHPKGFIAKIAW